MDYWQKRTGSQKLKMGKILNIETATTNCSVSLAEKGKTLILIEEDTSKHSHAEKIHDFILKTLKQSKTKAKELDAVSVSFGPGSYTGLRIGVSAAKGICFGLGIPLVKISTLKILAAQAKRVCSPDLIASVIDAKRQDVFFALYNKKLKEVQKPIMITLTKKTLSNELRSNRVLFVGSGAEKTKDHIKNPNASFLRTNPSAKEMAPLSYQKLIEKKTEDLASCEPAYINEFYTSAKKLSF